LHLLQSPQDPFPVLALATQSRKGGPFLAEINDQGSPCQQARFLQQGLKQKLLHGMAAKQRPQLLVRSRDFLVVIINLRLLLPAATPMLGAIAIILANVRLHNDFHGCDHGQYYCCWKWFHQLW